MFKGSNVALITPFKNNELDEETYIKLINFHLENGTNGLVPAGTTGESPTLSHSEHEKVIAGTGSNFTEEAISLTKHAEKAGADGALVVTPYYNKPTQEGLYQHYKAINDNTGLPIIIYNIPGRCVIDMSVDTMARLFELKNIAGVKDATGDLNRLDQTIKKLGPDFIQLTGEDGLVFQLQLILHLNYVLKCKNFQNQTAIMKLRKLNELIACFNLYINHYLLKATQLLLNMQQNY